MVDDGACSILLSIDCFVSRRDCHIALQSDLKLVHVVMTQNENVCATTEIQFPIVVLSFCYIFFHLIAMLWHVQFKQQLFTLIFFFFLYYTVDMVLLLVVI